MDTQGRQAVPDLTEGYAVTFFPVRWKPYKPGSQQLKKGIKGRWQSMTEYGGWENCEKPPVIVPLSKIDEVMEGFNALSAPPTAQGE